MTHPELVASLRKPGSQVLGDLDQKKLCCIELALALQSAAGALSAAALDLVSADGIMPSLRESPYDLTAERADLLHMVMGLAGEVGEILDVCKKFAIYNKPLDFAHLREELGDLLFYREGLRQNPLLQPHHTIQRVPEWRSLVQFQVRSVEQLHLLDAVIGDLIELLSNLAPNMTMVDIIQHNIAKLQIRYSEGKYSNEQAQTRADKPPGQ
jgi:MazG nucleotide pyrophosphohydrolase domain